MGTAYSLLVVGGSTGQSARMPPIHPTCKIVLNSQISMRQRLLGGLRDTDMAEWAVIQG